MTRSCMAWRAGVAAALLLSGLVPAARAAEMSAAMERLETAESVYADALERLREAEVELKAARELVARESGLRGGVHLPSASGATTRTPGAPGGLGAEAAGPDPASDAPEEPGFFAWKSWTKTVTVGLNGTGGNSEFLAGHVDVTLDRADKKIKTHFDGVYRTAQRDGEESENRVRLNLRNDWLPAENARWRMWAKGSYDYDGFQDWDHRASAHAGVGYEFIKQPDTTLVWRGGLGGTQTFGGTADDFRPEALLTGLDFVRQIKDDQKLTAGTEFFFDLSQTREYRINTSVDYEITLDKESGMIFKTGIDHRFDSRPGGTAQESDIDYFMSLGWKF